ARGLMMRGLAPAEAMTFLIAAPIVNPIVIITTHAAFGWAGGILVARLIGGHLIANPIGWIYSRHPSPDALLTRQFTATCERVTHEHGTPVRRSLTQFLIELRAVMPALVIGSALAGAVQVLIPRDVLLAIGSNPVLSIVAMMALAMTVAICSNVDAFFALSFASTFASGALIAFLLVVPLVDIKMLALLRITFTARTLVGVVAVVLVSAFAIGIGVNVLGLVFHAFASPCRGLALARPRPRRGHIDRHPQPRRHRTAHPLHQSGIDLVRLCRCRRRSRRSDLVVCAA